MLTITKEQFSLFSQLTFEQFERTLVAHCRDFSPDLCKTITENDLRLAVKDAMMRARNYGFTRRGPIRLFVEMTFLLGSCFDTDPQYPWVADILANPQRKEELSLSWDLYHAAVHYLETVQGQDDINTFNALRRLRTIASNNEILLVSSFSTDLLEGFRHIYPEKVNFLGHAAMLAMIDASIRRCSTLYNFTSKHAQILFCALSFAFGHGCDRDLLYPWIARTLTDELLETPEKRAQRLHRKAVTWLDHVLANG